jgi:hypothetical protein
MGELQWGELRHFLQLPYWRTMERLRFRTSRCALPVENVLDGSDGAIGAVVS